MELERVIAVAASRYSCRHLYAYRIQVRGVLYTAWEQNNEYVFKDKFSQFYNIHLYWSFFLENMMLYTCSYIIFR